MGKAFTTADVEERGAYARISAEPHELVRDEPEWMRLGLVETATGYGRRLNTGRKIDYNGRHYRLYATCFSNNASIWFKVKGRIIYVG